MTDYTIKRIQEENKTIGSFINGGFNRYGKQSGVTLDYDEFCFVAENADGRIIGAVTGNAYYDEVHIRDLIVEEAYRGSGVGSRLVRKVEETYSGCGYAIITLTTFAFQAPVFYRKLGYETEFIRESRNPSLNKYFFKKAL